MGNFSKNPDAVLQDALVKGYNRVLFQQGKPVLDRELNLLADLISPQRLIEHHIGNGVPDGSGGFSISNLNVAQNDFTIKAGRCLVGGHEVTLSGDTTYKTQPHAEHVAPLPAGTSYVYLRVFTNEVDHTGDSDLGNPGGVGSPDVGFETAVRRKVEWEVRVVTAEQTRADYFLLASINKAIGTITDRRRVGLTVAAIRDEITAARGTLASLDARLDVSLNESGTLKDGATVTGDLIVNGKLAVGTVGSANKLSVEGDSFFRTNIHIHVNASNSPGNLQLGFSRGTGSAPAAVLNGDAIGYLEFAGYNGSAYAVGAWIAARARENYTANASGTDLEFMTHEIGSNNNLVRMTIRNNGNVGIGTPSPLNKLDVHGGAVIGAGYAGAKSAPTDGLLVEGNVGIGTSPESTAKLKVNGYTRSLGLSVNDSSNTGVGRGVWLWNASDSNHVIYSANPTGKSPANNTAVAGYFDAGHRLRLRTATGQGFLFENSAETALVDIDSDNGKLWTRGAVHAGNSDLYFTKTDHNHTGIGNAVGYAAIENATNYGALMILGRNTGTAAAPNRVVKLWDYLQVNGRMDATGGAILNGVAVGVDPPGTVNFPFPYETVGTTNTSWNLRLHSYNAIYFHAGNSAAAQKGVDASGNWCGSTKEMKCQIQVFSALEARQALAGLNPVKFAYRADQNKKNHAGFIAEDVPEIIAHPNRRMISEMDIIAVLTRVVKEHEKVIDNLTKCVAEERP